MAAFDNITVNVNAKLAVDRSTADGCLKLLEIYMNDNRDLRIAVTRLDDGTEEYTIVGRCPNVGTQEANTDTASS